MLTQLGWSTLQERRARMRILLLYKATHHLVAVNSDLYLVPITAPTRQDHCLTFQRISTKTNYHKYSYYPRTIKEWNKLPAIIVECPDLDLFKVGLAGYSSPVALMYTLPCFNPRTTRGGSEDPSLRAFAPQNYTVKVIVAIFF